MTSGQRERIGGVLDLARVLMQQNDGLLPRGFVRDRAAALGVGKSTLHRYIRDGLPATVGRPRSFRWGVEEKSVLLMVGGDVTAARELLVAERGEAAVPSVRRLQQLKHEDLEPDEIAYCEKGAAAARAKRVALSVEHTRRNEIWLMDHKQLDVWVTGERSRKRHKPWVTLAVDGLSRRVVGWAIAVYRPSHAHVLAGLHAAVADFGTPESLLFDKGMEFTADAIRDVGRDLAFPALSTEAYHPHHKGKVERLAQTLGRRSVRFLPHRTDQPVDVTRKPLVTVRDHGGEPADAMPIEAFVRVFGKAVDEYNERVHSTHGASPREVFEEDATPMRRVSPEHLMRFMLKEDNRTIGNHGVRFKNRWYFHPDIAGHRGTRVEIRFRQDDLRRLHVFRDGRFWCTADLMDPASPSARDRVIADRRRRFSEDNKVRRRARRRAERGYAAITEAEPELIDTTIVTAEEATRELRGESKRRSLVLAQLMNRPTETGEP